MAEVVRATVTPGVDVDQVVQQLAASQQLRPFSGQGHRLGDVDLQDMD